MITHDSSGQASPVPARTASTAKKSHPPATEVLRLLGEELPPVHASADGLISVTMDSHFQIRSVTLQRLNLGLEEEARLEQAIATVVNAAVQAAAKQKGEQLKQMFGQT